MKMNPDFEIVEIAEEYIAVPTGRMALSYGGLVSLTEAAAFLLKSMKENRTEEELVQLLLDNYDVDPAIASADVSRLIQKFNELRLIEA